MAFGVLRDPMELDAKIVKRNGFWDSTKGQTDGLRDRNLMRHSDDISGVEAFIDLYDVPLENTIQWEFTKIL